MIRFEGVIQWEEQDGGIDEDAFVIQAESRREMTLQALDAYMQDRNWRMFRVEVVQESELTEEEVDAGRADQG